MLDKLRRGLMQDVPAFSQSDEQRATGLALLRPCRADFFSVDVYQGDRRLRTIQLGVTGCGENHLAVLGKQIDRLLVPKQPQEPGKLVFRNRLQAPVERKKPRITAEISAARD